MRKNIMENIAEVATETTINKLFEAIPEQYLPYFVILIVIILAIVVIMAVVIILNNKHMEKVNNRMIKAVEDAYKQALENQQETIKECNKLIDKLTKKIK